VAEQADELVIEEDCELLLLFLMVGMLLLQTDTFEQVSGLWRLFEMLDVFESRVLEVEL